MIGREFKFHNGKKGAALAIRMVEGCKETRIKKVLKDGTVLVEIAGTPKEPKQALLKLLSEELRVDLNGLDIIEGKDGTDLLISILDVGPAVIQERIMKTIS